jgi:hypothetical protein
MTALCGRVNAVRSNRLAARKSRRQRSNFHRQEQYLPGSARGIMKAQLLLLTLAAAYTWPQLAIAQGCAACAPPAAPDTVVSVKVRQIPEGEIPASSGAGEYSITVAQSGTAPLPAVLPAGTYQAWCGASPYDGVRDQTFTTASQPPLPSTVWSRINYVLNHKKGSVMEVQEAIWTLLGTVTVAELNSMQHVNAVAMAAEAIANGDNYVPPPGGRVGFFLVSPTEYYQDLIVELVYCAGVAGRVTLDVNNNRVVERVDPGLNGVTVQLLDSLGRVVASALTGPSPVWYPYTPAETEGWYDFRGICPGSYQVRVDPSQPALGGAAAYTPLSPAVTLGPGAPQTIDFGFYGGAQPLQVSCPQPFALPGTGYASKVHATGGAAPYAYTLTGSLPPGLSMSSSGAIAGIVAGAANPGAYAFTAPISAAGATPSSASCEIRIAPPVALACPAGPAQAGAMYAGAFSLSGGSGRYTVGILTPETFPAGLTVDAETGRVSGRPAAAGAFSFTAAVADRDGLAKAPGLGLCTMNIAPPTAPPAVACPAGSAQAGALYSSAIAASGGVAPYTFSIASGSLPAGLALNAATGAISGTPSTASVSSFVARVLDSRGTAAGTGTTSCGIDTAPAPLTVTCATSLAQVGAAYSSWVTADGGTGTYAFSIASGALPAGLTLNAATGAVTGTPNTAGTFSFTAKVTDAAGKSATRSCAITVSAASANQCGLSLGYWKNHTSAWPVNTLTLGDKTYSFAELVALLRAPTKGDASMILAHQLIAAKLNARNGANSVIMGMMIAEGDQHLRPYAGKLPHKVSPSSYGGHLMTVTAGVLEHLNTGCHRD